MQDEPLSKNQHARELGRLGEDAAAVYLERSGWRILRTNIRTRFGEVDIIAEDPCGERPTLVFVEVKTRSSKRFGNGIDSVAGRKLARLRKLAESLMSRQAHWLGPRPEFQDFRIDVVGVYFGRDDIPCFDHRSLLG